MLTDPQKVFGQGEEDAAAKADAAGQHERTKPYGCSPSDLSVPRVAVGAGGPKIRLNGSTGLASAVLFDKDGTMSRSETQSALPCLKPGYWPWPQARWSSGIRASFEDLLEAYGSGLPIDPAADHRCGPSNNRNCKPDRHKARFRPGGSWGWPDWP